MFLYLIAKVCLVGWPIPLNHAEFGVGIVINVFEAVDVIALIKGGVYDDLALNIGEALLKRSEVSWYFLRSPWPD